MTLRELILQLLVILVIGTSIGGLYSMLGTIHFGSYIAGLTGALGCVLFIFWADIAESLEVPALADKEEKKNDIPTAG